MENRATPPEHTGDKADIISHGTSFLPGFSKLRLAVKRMGARRGERALVKDVTAGLSVGINDVPDGMACGMLAGVSPLAGLYAAIFGPFVAGLFNSSGLMIVTTTGAAAFVSGQFIAGYPPEQKNAAMLMLVLTAGAVMVTAGVLRLGGLVQYVSYSVMTGFLYGIAVLTILSQLPAVLGIDQSGRGVLRTIELFADIGELHWQTFVVALVTFILLFTLKKTPLRKFATILAVAIPSLAVVLLDWEKVDTVGDISKIHGGLPELVFPEISLLTPSLIADSLLLCVVVLIQAAGVSQAIPNLSGKPVNHSRNFVGQGAANVASGLFGGIAVGGSLSSTSLNLFSGARTRWAALITGLTVFILVLLFPTIVTGVAMPVLATILIYASAGAIKRKELRQIWRLRHTTRILITSTFVVTLLFPIQYAVVCGIGVSVILYFYTSSKEVTMIALEPRSGRFAQTVPPQTLADNSITILQIHGDIHFAGARTVEKLLPQPVGHTRNAFVILRLRHRETMSATIIDVIDSYADRIAATGGALYVTGLSKTVAMNFRDMQEIHVLEQVKVYPETELIGEGTWNAYEDALQQLSARKNR